MDLRTILQRLRAHEADLRRRGILRLSVFGSIARGEQQAGSDVDLAAQFDPSKRLSLIDHVRLERHLSEVLGRKVDVVAEPVSRKPNIQAEIDRDRVVAFQ